MNLITARNVDEVLPVALDRMFKFGVERESRNGKVLQLRGPSIVCYERPTERVLFWRERDANPFFHLMESLWMLAGRNDVGFVANYAKRMFEYSDDGKTLNGAYGHRWIKHFGYNQLEWIADELKANPLSRRCVLQMWDAGAHDGEGEAVTGTGDLYLATHGSLDVPCNTQAYFAINDSGRLDLTVCNRSNDLVWGCLGANAVHFSILLEYMAIKIGVPVGFYYQMTNNLHGYLSTIEPLRCIAGQYLASPYELNEVQPFPLIPDVGQIEEFEGDLPHLGDRSCYASFFFCGVVAQMEAAFELYKEKALDSALEACGGIMAKDWRLACQNWIQRRINKRLKAADDGVNYEK